MTSLEVFDRVIGRCGQAVFLISGELSDECNDKAIFLFEKNILFLLKN